MQKTIIGEVFALMSLSCFATSFCFALQAASGETLFAQDHFCVLIGMSFGVTVFGIKRLWQA